VWEGDTPWLTVAIDLAVKARASGSERECGGARVSGISSVSEQRLL